MKNDTPSDYENPSDYKFTQRDEEITRTPNELKQPAYGRIMLIAVIAVCIVVIGVAFLVRDTKQSSNSYSDNNVVGKRFPDSSADEETVVESLNELDISPAFKGETLTFTEEPAVEFTGTMEYERQTDTYTYTAPRWGLYGFNIEDTKDQTYIEVTVYDSNGDEVSRPSGFGEYAYLNANETYTIKAKQSYGLTSYVLSVGVPKDRPDITSVTTIKDQISYIPEINVYSFTVPLSGKYWFELTDVYAGVRYNFMLWDSLDNDVFNVGYTGVSADLDAGEQYRLAVQFDEGFGSYTLNIGYQKETVDITGYDVVSDSVEFGNQQNIYMFTPSMSKDYTFSFSDHNASCDLRLTVWDAFGYDILDMEYDSGTVSLESGQEYKIIVYQDDGYGPYKLNIT